MISALFSVGDTIAVRRSYPLGHVRTPYFIRGQSGVIVEVVGAFADPQELAYGRNGKPAINLYRVRFLQSEVWSEYEGSTKDTLLVDLYENWLQPTESKI